MFQDSFGTWHEVPCILQRNWRIVPLSFAETPASLYEPPWHQHHKPLAVHFSRRFVLCCADPCLSCQHHTVLITAVLSTISLKIRLIIISPIILFFINTIRAHLGTLLFYKNIKITFSILNRSLLVLESMIRIALTLEINRIVETGMGRYWHVIGFIISSP